MLEKIFVDWEEALAAVKFKGNWRFFYDMDSMFLLDYSSYDDRYHPSEGEFRYGTMIVDGSNAEKWMNSILAEVSLEQIPYIYLEDSEKSLPLMFLIDFDEKLWVGSRYHMDQLPLHEYQPQGWTAIEELTLNYLPANLKGYFI